MRGVAHNMRVPLVMLMGYRGRASLGTARPDTAAELFEPTLAAWRIPWSWLSPDSLPKAFRKAEADSRPVAVVFEGRLE
jgi:hypothetical protein